MTCPVRFASVMRLHNKRDRGIKFRRKRCVDRPVNHAAFHVSAMELSDHHPVSAREARPIR
jgi:hypothetical protein